MAQVVQGDEQTPTERAAATARGNSKQAARYGHSGCGGQKRKKKQDKHPWELFTVYLHNAFLALLRTWRVMEDEMGVLFDAKQRSMPRDS